MEGRSPEAVVIGAGVIGCSVALELARSGREVLVLDKGPAAGSGSTSSSSAIVRFHYSTREGVAAAWESFHLWQDWPDYLGVEDELGFARYHRCGMLAFDPPGTDHSKVFSFFDEIGVPYEVLDADALAARFPAMDTGRFWPPVPIDADDFDKAAEGRLDAYFTPDAGFVDDPQLAAHNLMTAARAAGATFRFRTEVAAIAGSGSRVTGVKLSDGTGLDVPIVVNVAGPHSRHVNELAGVVDDLTVGTAPMRQEVHAVPAPPGFGLHDGGTTVSDPDLGTYFRPQPGGTLLVGGVEPECDPLQWVDDPDAIDPTPSIEAFESQVYRTARRLPGLSIPSRPIGLAACYDVTPDWTPIYDRTRLDGYYVAIGTSGNQFKNAPVVGRFLTAIINACESGHDHDADPVSVRCERTGHVIDLSHYSRHRTLYGTTNSVLG